MFEFVRQVAFVLSAFGASAIPGLLVGTLMNNMGVGLYVALGSVFVFFPFLMLSFVDAESPFTPYSSFIASTLKTVTNGWVKFYLLAGLVAAVAAIPHVVTVLHAMEVLPATFRRQVSLDLLEVVSIAVTFMGVMVYFRLLGRLAYVIDNKTSVRVTTPSAPQRNAARD